MNRYIFQLKHKEKNKMGIRLNGISTPFGGVQWEYTDEGQQYDFEKSILPSRKLRVFISSICGDNGKYDRVRNALKKKIEDTQLAEVYLFEDEPASTLPAEKHYTGHLEDSDVCIFLIDNADGVSQGVQKEINTARKSNIKSLFYFCDETSKEKTSLEKSLLGATFAKSKTVHKFDDLSINSAQALISDIMTVYLDYCKGRLSFKSEDKDQTLPITDLKSINSLYTPKIPKSIIDNIDICINYILKMTVNLGPIKIPDEKASTSKIDEWAEHFLTILFGSKSIKDFNTSMFLEDLKEVQDETYFNVVNLRWMAIQSYFLNDIPKCIDYLKKACDLAKQNSQPTWIIQDILIDLRNQQITLDTINNQYTESLAQEELDEIDEKLYYPVLDRINESLEEKYIKGLYKQKIESPYTTILSNGYFYYRDFASLLASSFIVSLYNGSLTHILLFYEKIKSFSFYLSCRYNDWILRKNLLKLAIFTGKENEVKKVTNSYSEILNNMDHKDALEIMEFCENQPIKYKRTITKLLAFGVVADYLSDNDYKKYEDQIIALINEWLNEENIVIAVGNSVFYCLSKASQRLNQNTLADICCTFIDKHYKRWYRNIFHLIANNININKMSIDHAQSLIQNIINVVKDPQNSSEIMTWPLFLCILRKQNYDLTEELDQSVIKYLPEFYNGIYKLETTTEKQKDYPDIIQEYIEQIENNNVLQGQNGTYFERASRDIATIKALLSNEDFVCPSNIIDSLISAVSDTLLKSKEGLTIKLDAVNLLIFLVFKYPKSFENNKHVFQEIIDQKSNILDIDNTMFLSNIDTISLKVALSLLQISMNDNCCTDIMEELSYIQDDIATTNSVTSTIKEYLEIDNKIKFPENVEIVIIQNVLQWLQLNNVDIKWNATHILFMLTRSAENESFINNKIINLIDDEGIYVKIAILRQIYLYDGISESTRNYVISKCENDPCYVVRKTCEEIKPK